MCATGPRNLKPIGEIALSDIMAVSRNDDSRTTFRIITPHRTYLLVAESEEERSQWISGIERMQQQLINLPGPSLDLDSLLGALYCTVLEIRISEALQRRLSHDVLQQALTSHSSPTISLSSSAPTQLELEASSTPPSPHRMTPPPSQQRKSPLLFHCELKYGQHRVTTTPMKIQSSSQVEEDDKDVVFYCARNSDVNSRVGSGEASDAACGVWEQSFKFLIFDVFCPLSLSLFLTREKKSHHFTHSISGNETNLRLSGPNSSGGNMLLGERKIDLEELLLIESQAEEWYELQCALPGVSEEEGRELGSSVRMRLKFLQSQSTLTRIPGNGADVAADMVLESSSSLRETSDPNSLASSTDPSSCSWSSSAASSESSSGSLSNAAAKSTCKLHKNSLVPPFPLYY